MSRPSLGAGIVGFVRKDARVAFANEMNQCIAQLEKSRVILAGNALVGRRLNEDRHLAQCFGIGYSGGKRNPLDAFLAPPAAGKSHQAS